MHNIDDELVFTNHDGYLFHDSRGFEAGGEEELTIVQDFVRRKSREKLLKNKLHAIWFVPWASTISNSQTPRQVLHSDGQCPARARFEVF
jgi:hypothetical protein